MSRRVLDQGLLHGSECRQQQGQRATHALPQAQRTGNLQTYEHSLAHAAGRRLLLSRGLDTHCDLHCRKIGYRGSFSSFRRFLRRKPLVPQWREDRHPLPQHLLHELGIMCEQRTPEAMPHQIRQTPGKKAMVQTQTQR
jgi:hypothetical protein